MTDETRFVVALASFGCFLLFAMLAAVFVGRPTRGEFAVGVFLMAPAVIAAVVFAGVVV